MAVLTSKEGKFYEVPDDVLKKHEVPQQKVKEILAGLDAEMGPAEGPGGAPLVVIQVVGSGAHGGPEEGPEGPEEDVEPYHYYKYGWHPHHYWYPYRRRRRHHYYYGY